MSKHTGRYLRIDRYMLVKGERKFIVKYHKPRLFSKYKFAEDEYGFFYKVSDCQEIKLKKRGKEKNICI